MNKYHPNYFKKSSDLSEDKKKWCRCVLHVAAKQTDQCLENVNRTAGQVFHGNVCYNPYKVCSATIKTSCRQCGINYEFRNIPDNELRAYGKLKKIKIPSPYSRELMIVSIMNWKVKERHLF